MKEKLTTGQKLLRCIPLVALPLAVGIISSLITGDAMMHYGQMNKPPLAPPAWLFPIAWTILYILMGVGSYFLFIANPTTGKGERSRWISLIIYFVQLIFNFCWSLFFFLGKMYLFSFIWLIIMWVMIIFLVFKSAKASMLASVMFMPYLLWCTFAAYLNLMAWILN